MEEILNIKDYLEISAQEISIPITILNFIISLVVSLVIRYYYVNFSNSLSSKLHIGSIIPILSSVVFLVIVIVKSSLALSLGLVGALSIVRFRTPIKEPEELVFLFLSISVGLGFGAGYPLITSILVTMILIFNYLFVNQNKKYKELEYNLIIEKTNQELKFDDLISVISEYTDTINLVRIDSNSENHSIVFKVSLKSKLNIDSIIKKIQNNNTSISFFESKTNW